VSTEFSSLRISIFLCNSSHSLCQNGKDEIEYKLQENSKGFQKETTTISQKSNKSQLKAQVKNCYFCIKDMILLLESSEILFGRVLSHVLTSGWL